MGPFPNECVPGVAAVALPERSDKLQRAAAQAGVQVNVHGRLLDAPPGALSSLPLLMRELAEELKMSGPAALQLADSAGVPIRSDMELQLALHQGRHPLRATLTVAALREIEHKKWEVENKKEDLTQFQWKIVVDQIASFSSEVATMAAQLQSVKDECSKELRKAHDEAELRHNDIVQAVVRESQKREASHEDLAARIDQVILTLGVEKQARDVADHQLGQQVEQIAAGLDLERSSRAQEHSSAVRLLDATRHDLDVEMQKSSEQWNQHLGMVKHLQTRVEDCSVGNISQQHRLSQLEADAEKLRSVVAGLEATAASQARAMREDIQRRGTELSKAVREEILSREHQLTSFAKDLETSWQSLEARMQRAREDASEGNSTIAERARVLEDRCASLERTLQSHEERQATTDRTLVERVTAAADIVDSVEMGHKASDVVLQTTVAKVEDIMERLQAAEGDLHQKANPDFWRPQMEALQRGLLKLETKQSHLEKDTNARFLQESAHRDGVKAQLQDTMKSCLDKIGGSRPALHQKEARFIEVTDEAASPVPARAAGAGMGGHGCPALAHVSSSAKSIQILTVSPPKLPAEACSGGNGIVRQASATGYSSPRHVVASSPPRNGPQALSANMQRVVSPSTVRMLSPRNLMRGPG